MKLTVNNEAVTTEATTVKGLLEELLGKVPAGTAVAVDGDVVPKSQWETHSLSEDARVDILTAVQGG
ncbi:sulfur carrier protein ThiS [Corynebacterium sp. MSK044]|uniref:sulfur carrier protein ThiS n=1 Tax=unclassified Corynebacterium TaxID=2624378 RepID=UPI00254A6798|nr:MULTISPECIES: sulfur carrier protein ThiS [unclassified Corynebacterium]MDK8795826.1 sulfur carrier protein ThiS [Corynebacterium sp. MSK041]MDK8797811.1 sulfur carrier protein ThiS [Corynebacterium sp. MSK044]